MTGLRFRPEPKPLADTCEAIAFLYADQLPSELYERLASPTLDLLETISNLIELRPTPATPQLAIPLGDTVTRGFAEA